MEERPMHLTRAQLDAYDRDGFLIFPDLVSKEEVALVKAGIARASQIQDDRVIRERGGDAVRMVYGLNEIDGPTSCAAVADLACSGRLLQTAKDILRDDAYLFHTKCNVKDAITGEIWQWHQDFGYWRTDGISEPRMITTMLMLDNATELGGCLYFVPGSHKDGTIDAPFDSETTSVGLWTLSKEQMTDLVARRGEPVPVVGGPGTVAMFHPDLVHGSGHNMSTHARWQMYFVYNAVSNAMAPVAEPRPAFKASRDAVPLKVRDRAPVVEPA
jgi:ectoine hydroxylase